MTTQVQIGVTGGHATEVERLRDRLYSADCRRQRPPIISIIIIIIIIIIIMFVVLCWVSQPTSRYPPFAFSWFVCVRVCIWSCVRLLAWLRVPVLVALLVVYVSRQHLYTGFALALTAHV